MLRLGGRLAYYVIHVTPNLSPRDYRRASKLGPPEVGSQRDSVTLMETAGFVDVVQIDVTEEFLRTCRALQDVSRRYSAQLRQEEGESAFEEEQAKTRCNMEGIETGLLRRSLLVGIKPARRRSKGGNT